MKTKVAIWNLKSGMKNGQESYDVKKQKGLEYVELLKTKHEVIEVIESEEEIKIIMKDE